MVRRPAEDRFRGAGGNNDTRLDRIGWDEFLPIFDKEPAKSLAVAKAMGGGAQDAPQPSSGPNYLDLFPVVLETEFFTASALFSPAFLMASALFSPAFLTADASF